MATLVKVIVTAAFEDNFGYGFSDELAARGLAPIRRKGGDVIPVSDVQKYHPRFLSSLHRQKRIKIEFYDACPSCGTPLEVPALVLLDDKGAPTEVEIKPEWVYGEKH